MCERGAYYYPSPSYPLRPYNKFLGNLVFYSPQMGNHFKKCCYLFYSPQMGINVGGEVGEVGEVWVLLSSKALQ